ncbi:Transposable element tcb2 transposase [Caligus rogercresseyi]|uniref:Transposable element tcb2 transposase n=1 Tax=Caligus rogercresseyi TaxID=217165 RepID=A0A7T8JYW2_CALRO|nr:Transposable element tcb2 transposase [Caligus rogercresseyi]
MMIRAGYKDMEIMKTACVARNTAKSIRSDPRGAHCRQTKFPAAMIVFGIIGSDGPETGLGGYVALMRDVVAPWIKKVAAGRPTSVAQNPEVLSENLDDYTSPNIWLPNSPDCNPCDFYPWGALNARITLCFKKLPRDQVRCACSRFQSRLKTVVEVKGAYFE